MEGLEDGYFVIVKINVFLNGNVFENIAGSDEFIHKMIVLDESVLD